jgi:large subunit ribosomal protein L7/L12
MADIQKIVDEVKALSVVEVNDLVKKLEEEFGVSAAAATVVAGPAAGAAAPAEEKSEFDIVLKEVGASKINVIKVVKDITGLGLADAKALVDGAPSTIKEKVATKDAKEFEEKLKAAGATVELK